MIRLRPPHRMTALLAAAVLGLAAATVPRAEEPPGLLLSVKSGGASDMSVADGVALYVQAGRSATPFVPAGRFTAVWTGNVAAELRADFVFHAAFAGHLRLSLNDAVVLDADGKGHQPVDGSRVRLNKGANRLVAEYTAPESGDAFVRLYWSNKETPFNPVPVSVLTRPDPPELAAAIAAHRGRELLVEHRCVSCHAAPGGMPELKADAPAFAGIGSRRRFDWLARWIENPAVLRPGTPMPAVFAGPGARENSEAVAAFLASLADAAPPTAADPGTDTVAAGKALYEKLHCVACHDAPDAGSAAAKISQKQVLAKFAPGALVDFLLKPERHYAWIRMPNFRLTPAEAGQLAAYLESAADKPADRAAPADEAVLKKGRALVQNSGCLNCHALDVQNLFAAAPLSGLPADAWTRGCVADAPSGNAPRYALDDSARKALRAFAATDRASLARHTDADFLERQSRALNCRECHGKFEGFPSWELLGGKLRPDWAARFISGAEAGKPRSWLESRMPAFPAYASALGAGLATAHGHPPAAVVDDPPDAALADTGRKLVGANGGFACVSCHGVGEFGATQVFEAPGINLAKSFARLQPDFFRRWLRNPPALDPNSKMPAYFDEEGRSALADVLDGDGPKTIRAVWEYLRLGDKMPPPQ